MMKRRILMVVLLLTLTLSACNGTDGSENGNAGENTVGEASALTPTITEEPNTVGGADTPAPTITEAGETSAPTPTVTESPAAVLDRKAEEYLAGLETIDWTELNYEVDEKTSIRNSNLLSYGYLTYDDNENIYFSDRHAGGIYASDYKGGNKRLLAEDKGSWLQVKGDWLYYNSEVCGIDRIHIVTGEREHVYESSCGEFVIIEEGLLINAPGALVLLDVENNKQEIIEKPEEISFAQVSSGITEDFFLCNAYLSYSVVGNMDLLSKGYLLKSDGESLKLINKRGLLPLVAGSYLSVFNPETQKRQIWDLESKEIVDLYEYEDQTVVSDGQYVYYKEIMFGHEYLEAGEPSPKKMTSFIFKWDGEEKELIWRINADNLHYMFITPKALYCLPQVNDNYEYQLMYYDLETGETGRIY